MSHPLFDLSGRVAMVSGAASGMGRQMALGFAEVGADVVLADINLPGAEQTADDIDSIGRRALAVRCNVSEIEQEVMQNLVVGRFTSCQEAGRRMLAQGKGSIINLGSIGGWNSLGRGHTPYGMAMGAGIQMTRELSTEWASRGVRVNAILPAQVWNDGLRKRIASTPELEDTFKGGIPMGRLGNPEEIKGPAIFLASDASSFVTGAILPMDGGNLAMNAGGTYPGSPRSYA